MSTPTTLEHIEGTIREIEVHVSLQQDIVRFCAPVLAGIRPSAMFSCPRTLKPREQITTPTPQVLLEDEFRSAYRTCTQELVPYGINVDILAQREHSAMLLVYRKEFVAQALQYNQVAHSLKALGYCPNNLDESLAELAARIREFDNLNRQRSFWDFPHEIGYFLGYPAPDVIAYTRNRARGYAIFGTWSVYGCKRRVGAAVKQFRAHAECTQAYWQLYLEGATLGQLAALGTLSAG